MTLPELLIALVLFAVVAGAATRVLRTQQRFLHGAAALGELRSQLRQAVHVLPAELRQIAPAAGDIHEWSSTAVRFRSVTGSSVICRQVSGSVVILPGYASAADDPRAFTTWLVTPQPGDSLLVHDEHDLGSADDTWHTYEIAEIGVAAEGEQCNGPNGLQLKGLENRAVRLRLAHGASLSGSIRPGAPVRFFRPVRYALYQGGDGKWYLGASDCNATRVPPCSTIQPVSGPYRSRDGSAPGLSLIFEDQHGGPLSPGIDDPAAVAVVRLMVRGQAAGNWWGRGSHSALQDSLEFTVAMRTRPSALGTGDR